MTKADIQSGCDLYPTREQLAERLKAVKARVKVLSASEGLDAVIAASGTPAPQVAHAAQTVKKSLRRLEVAPAERIVAVHQTIAPHRTSGTTVPQPSGPAWLMRHRQLRVPVTRVWLVVTSERLLVDYGKFFLSYDLSQATLRLEVVRDRDFPRERVALKTPGGNLIWECPLDGQATPRGRQPAVDIDGLRTALITGIQAAKPKAVSLSTRSSTSCPKPRLIRTPRDAEQVVMEWLNFWGLGPCRLTPVTGDGGIDVCSGTVVAQVKMEALPVGRPVVQQIFGVASLERKSAAVFGLAGFTEEAKEWAGRAGVALFCFDLQGEPVPVNHCAQHLVE